MDLIGVSVSDSFDCEDIGAYGRVALESRAGGTLDYTSHGNGTDQKILLTFRREGKVLVDASHTFA